MVQSLVKSIFSLLPISVKNTLREVKFWSLKLKTIKNWEKSGRPLPPPHEVKQEIIAKYQKQFGYSLFIETGTYLGDMIVAQMNNFNRLITVELGVDLWQQAKKKFSRDLKVTLLNGDSGKVIVDIMKDVNESAIFWLDGHYSAGDTSKGDKECPIYEELTGILKAKPLPHVILIDDARCFIGNNDYPTIGELLDFVSGINPNYDYEVKTDIIRLTPRGK